MENNREIAEKEEGQKELRRKLLNAIKELEEEEKLEQETMEEAARNYEAITEYSKYQLIDAFIAGANWQKEQICNSEVLQKIRASKSDSEARRIIRTL